MSPRGPVHAMGRARGQAPGQPSPAVVQGSLVVAGRRGVWLGAEERECWDAANGEQLSLNLWQSCCRPCRDFTLKGYVKKYMNSFYWSTWSLVLPPLGWILEMTAENLAPGMVLKSWKLVQFPWWTPAAIVFYCREAAAAQMLTQNESAKPSHERWLFRMSCFETYAETGPRTTCQPPGCCLCGHEITADLPQVCSRPCPRSARGVCPRGLRRLMSWGSSLHSSAGHSHTHSRQLRRLKLKTAVLLLLDLRVFPFYQYQL